MTKKASETDPLRESSLRYHRHPPAGKLEIKPTKPMANQLDLAQAYSPGVAYPCLEIKDNPATAAEYTARANLVGVVTNGSAVLGLGAIGPLASKPVMTSSWMSQTLKSWWKRLRASSQPSARSTSRTSKHPSVSSWNANSANE